MDQVSPQVLAARLNDGSRQPLLLDVRTPIEHQEVHLPQARLRPLDELDAAQLAKQEGQDCEVVVICRSGGRASKAAEKLAAAGMSKVSVLDGGMQAWTGAGLPANRGQKMMSLERQVRIAAGSMVVIGVALGTLVHPGFYGLSAFVGAGLVFAGVTDWCGMGLLLAKAPWNQTGGSGSCCATKSAR
ncbi:rhodanese-like domain-containing protein [Phragmitibacter flavus]|uniref:rhodanese-like domain-containing protein n=1 Tax=Phragmitibacter flavus TaxID=2576071 RepID=UPI003CCCDBF9